MWDFADFEGIRDAMADPESSKSVNAYGQSQFQISAAPPQPSVGQHRVSEYDTPMPFRINDQGPISLPKITPKTPLPSPDSLSASSASHLAPIQLAPIKNFGSDASLERITVLENQVANLSNKVLELLIKVDEKHSKADADTRVLDVATNSDETSLEIFVEQNEMDMDELILSSL